MRLAGVGHRGSIATMSMLLNTMCVLFVVIAHHIVSGLWLQHVDCTSSSLSANPQRQEVNPLSNSTYYLRDCNVSIRFSKFQPGSRNITIIATGGTALPTIDCTEVDIAGLSILVDSVHCSQPNWTQPFFLWEGLTGALCTSLKVSMVNSQIRFDASGNVWSSFYTSFVRVSGQAHDVQVLVENTSVALYAAVTPPNLIDLSGLDNLTALSSLRVHVLASLVTLNVSGNAIAQTRVAVVSIDAGSSRSVADVTVLVANSTLAMKTGSGFYGCGVSVTSFATENTTLLGRNSLTVINSSLRISSSYDGRFVGIMKFRHLQNVTEIVVANSTLEVVMFPITTSSPTVSVVAMNLFVATMATVSITLIDVLASLVAVYDAPPKVSSFVLASSLVNLQTTTSLAMFDLVISSTTMISTQRGNVGDSFAFLVFSLQSMETAACSINSIGVLLTNATILLTDVRVDAQSALWHLLPLDTLNTYIVPALHALVTFNTSISDGIELRLVNCTLVSVFSLSANAAPGGGGAKGPFLAATVAAVSFASPQISEAQVILAYPQFAFAARSKPTSAYGLRVSLQQCAISSTSTFLPSEMQLPVISLIVLPNVANASRLNVTNTTVTVSTGANASAIVCPTRCIIGDHTRIAIARIGLLRGPMVAFAASETTTGSSSLTMVDSSMDLLGISSTVPESLPSVFQAGVRVVIQGELATLKIDGCVFWNYSTLFDATFVSWGLPSSSSSPSQRPTLIIGCNLQKSSSSVAAMIPIEPLRIMEGVVVEYPDTAFSSPYLPWYTCAGNQEATHVLAPPPRSSVTAATSAALIGVIAVARGIVPSAGGGIGGMHSLQATQLIRRRRLLCGNTGSSVTNGGDAEAVQALETICCDPSVDPLGIGIVIAGNSNQSALESATTAFASQLFSAVVGNTVTVVVWVTVKACAQLIIRRFHSVSDCEPPATCGASLSLLVHAALEPVGPLASLWLPYTTLLSPTLATSLALALLHSGSSVGLVVAGSLGLIFWSLPWVMAAVMVCWRWGRPFPFLGAAPRGRPSRSSCATFVLEPLEFMYAPAASRPFAKELLRSSAPVFEGYVVRRYWYFTIEVAFASATGLVMGIVYHQAAASGVVCGASWTDWVLFALAVAEVVSGAALLRPFSAYVDTASVASVVGLSAVAQLIMIVGTDGQTAMDVADALALVSTLLSCLFLLLSVPRILVVGRLRNGSGIQSKPNTWLTSVAPIPLREQRNLQRRRRMTTSKLLPSELRFGSRLKDHGATQLQALAALIELTCANGTPPPLEVPLEIYKLRNNT